MKKIIMQLIGSSAMLLLLMTFAMSACNTTSQTVTQEKRAKTYSMAGADWIFTPNTANPQSGSTRQISSGYNVKLTGTKLMVYLPYYGQASIGADLFSGRSPLDFTSTDFTSDGQSKKGAWNISIKPRDYSEVQSMEFSFYDNGTAYLRVIMLHRSSISFTGNVEQVKS